MTEDELKIKLQEFGFETKDGVEWVQHLEDIGRIGVRFNYMIYKTREVRITIGFGVTIHDVDNTYESAYKEISEIMIKNTLLS